MFRTDFKDLSLLKAFFPFVPTLALTAAASPQMLIELKESLMLTRCKTVCVNPNRCNNYLEKKDRLITNQYAGDSNSRAGTLFAQFHSPETDRMKTLNENQERKLNNKSNFLPHQL